jgi:mRNA interferase YafQ
MAIPGGLRLKPTKAFERDLKRLGKRGVNMERLGDVIEQIRQGRGLEARHCAHAPSGDWTGWHECHIAPDWLLIYRETEGELILGRTGTHSDLFG